MSRRVVNARPGRAPQGRARPAARPELFPLRARPPAQLDFLRFPLGDLPKAEVRAIAAGLGLEVAAKPDSQDICFVPDGDYAALVKRFRPETPDAAAISSTSPAMYSATHQRRRPFHRRPAPRDRDRRPARAALRGADRAPKRSGWWSVPGARLRSRPCAVARNGTGSASSSATLAVKVRSLAPAVPAVIEDDWITFAETRIWRRAGTGGGRLRRELPARRRMDRRDGVD